MARLDLTFPSELPQVRAVAEEVKAFLSRQQVPKRIIQECELALVEACNNAVVHRISRNSPEVNVEVVCSETLVEVRVLDFNTPIPWPEEFKLPPIDAETGRGLFMIHSLVNELSYERKEGRNCLRFMKRLV
ncbi:MAG: ATP-binding protein [Verrucomicrobiota bacterium]|nr:ATP-binding protein [Verrucomicrobiota bacterium]